MVPSNCMMQGLFYRRAELPGIRNVAGVQAPGSRRRGQKCWSWDSSLGQSRPRPPTTPCTASCLSLHLCLQLQKASVLWHGLSLVRDGFLIVVPLAGPSSSCFIPGAGGMVRRRYGEGWEEGELGKARYCGTSKLVLSLCSGCPSVMFPLQSCRYFT